MPREMGIPKYFKYNDCKDGDVLVQKGEFLGVTQGKFGNQYNFLQLDDNQHVVLNKAGSIEWRINQNHIREGDVMDITFGGKEKMESGSFAGKDANTFTFAKYEDEELPEAFVSKRNAKTAKAPVSTPKSNEALDSLE